MTGTYLTVDGHGDDMFCQHRGVRLQPHRDLQQGVPML
jgi:hypothetical protein